MKNVHQSLLVITQTPAEQSELQQFSSIDLDQATTDLLVIEPEKSIKIDQIRLLKQFLSTHPLTNSHKLVLILQANTMTLPAQNALLKILEEPPSYGQIILTTKNSNQLLPTILSRCVIKTVVSDLAENQSADNQLETLANLSLADRLVWVEDVTKDKEGLKPKVEELILELRQSLIKNPNKQNLYNLTLGLYTAKLLRSNVNPKLVMDNLALRMK